MISAKSKVLEASQPKEPWFQSQIVWYIKCWFSISDLSEWSRNLPLSIFFVKSLNSSSFWTVREWLLMIEIPLQSMGFLIPFWLYRATWPIVQDFFLLSQYWPLIMKAFAWKAVSEVNVTVFPFSTYYFTGSKLPRMLLRELFIFIIWKGHAHALVDSGWILLLLFFLCHLPPVSSAKKIQNRLQERVGQ